MRGDVMSKFSGKCDLYDHIMMMKQYPHPNNPNILVSDELECFELFKEATNGVIYKSINVQVNQHNQEIISKMCPYFNFEPLPRPSRRHKQRYMYKYFGKDTTLKELNKTGISIDMPIYFDSLLDIIPYYPYIITCAFCTDGKQHIILSNKSFVDSRIEDGLKYGHFPYVDYKKELQKHYIEVVHRYFSEKDNIDAK